MGARSRHQFVRDKLPLLSCSDLRAGEHCVLPTISSIVGLGKSGCCLALFKKVASPTLIHKERAISLFFVKVSSIVEHHKAWIVHNHIVKAGFVTQEINILPDTKAVGHRTLKPMGLTLPYPFINFIVD